MTYDNQVESRSITVLIVLTREYTFHATSTVRRNVYGIGERDSDHVNVSDKNE